MYLPTTFSESRPELVQKLMRENSFATVVSMVDGAPFASHVPVLVESPPGDGALKIRGHLARANPQWRHLANGEQVLAIFHGPHGYVSPAWYADPQSVPTWNYAAVHAYGRAALLDTAGLRTLLKALVDVHEGAFARPWRFESLPADFVEGLLAAIVGFEISVDSVEAKLKLSQNRPPEDQRQVRDQLAASADPVARDVAAWMDLLGRVA
jgi:transcriptional regulator